jgi:hypothetical protein
VERLEILEELEKQDFLDGLEILEEVVTAGP